MTRPFEILLVEDNPGDVFLAREEMEASKVANNLSVVDDGEKAMSFLRRQAPYHGALMPDLILLDLNLPRKDGREVLAEIKVDPSLMRIPVVVLTTSSAEEDVLKSYNLHANCYITKPIELSKFIEVVHSIRSFWLYTATLPNAH